MSKVTEEQFVDHVIEPDGPDEMAFILRGQDPDPERGFSKEGVERIGANIEQFMLARTYAHYKRTGKMPKNLRATVSIDWIGPEDEWLEQGPRPWFALNDRAGDPLDPDGTHRSGGDSS